MLYSREALSSGSISLVREIEQLLRRHKLLETQGILEAELQRVMAEPRFTHQVISRLYQMNKIRKEKNFLSHSQRACK